MHYIVLDVETTATILPGGERSPSPFFGNKLVCIGYTVVKNKGDIVHEDCIFLHSNDPTFKNIKEEHHNKFEIFKRQLKSALFIVGHNIAFDLMWLLEVGCDYKGPVFDTMLTQYVLNCGIGHPDELGLDTVCAQYGIEGKISETSRKFKQGIDYADMSIEEVTKYNMQDVHATLQLYLALDERLTKFESLIPVVNLTNEYCPVLVSMTRHGIKIDVEALQKIKTEYRQEKTELENKVFMLIKKVMGDRPYNPSSPEQLSQIIYSRKVKDKKVWADIFNIGTEMRNSVRKPKRVIRYDTLHFVEIINEHMEILYKEKKIGCTVCKSTGMYYKVKKDGGLSSKQYKCKSCGGTGVSFVKTKEIAGFGCAPVNVTSVTSGGFSASKDTLLILHDTVTEVEAKEFFTLMVRLNQVDHYLSSFIPILENNMDHNHVVHISFDQYKTATGRLSSPFHNLPRGTTFPVKKAYTSKFKDGVLLTCDHAQLEFIIAVFLSGDKKGKEDVRNKVDKHAYTASIIGCSRQDAKPHTFKPLYGGTTGTEREQAYYKAFLEMHPGIKKWHDALGEMAYNFKMITIPSGRIYRFPNIIRYRNGGYSHQTQYKNYPVQGFATGDIVPACNIAVHNALVAKGFRSHLNHTVHDDFMVDIDPQEFDAVIETVCEVMDNAVEIVKDRFGLDNFDLPLRYEIKVGRNGFEMMDLDKWNNLQKTQQQLQ